MTTYGVKTVVKYGVVPRDPHVSSAQAAPRPLENSPRRAPITIFTSGESTPQGGGEGGGEVGIGGRQAKGFVFTRDKI